MNNINESNIPICITGSIAAYKFVDSITSFKKNHQVHVVMTKSAKIFTSNCGNS